MTELLTGLSQLTVGHIAMFIIGGALIYLAVQKDYEPSLLLPMGFGAIAANIPNSSAVGPHGFLTTLFDAGIKTELFPVLIFIAIGAMIDFSPLIQNPRLLLFGAAAQFGVFFTMALAAAVGFTLKQSAAIGIIGAADGPTSILVATRLAQEYLAPITVAAYSYMALVPIIQPPIIRLLTTVEQRKIRMEFNHSSISRTTKILFPIMVAIVAGIIAPLSVALIAPLMFGNLIRESGVLERLSRSAQNELANLVTLLLGITVGSTMTAQAFLNADTFMIIGMGLIAFIFDTAGGVIFARVLNLFLKVKINPMVGAAGISAFPMSARVIHKMGKQEDPGNYLLMPAIAANVAGQIGSVIAGGLILALIVK